MARFGYGSSILTSLNLCVLAPLREILLWRLGVRSLSAFAALQSSACSANAFPLASFFFKAAKRLLILA